MSIVSLFKDKLRRRKSEQISEGYPAYRSVLIDVIEGREDSIDPAELELILTSVGKSIDDIEKDSKLLERRIRWDEEHKAGKDAGTKMQAEQSKFDSLKSELQAHRDRLEPMIRSQGEKLRELHTASTSGAVALSELENIRNVIDAGLVDRIRTLDHRIKEIVSDQRQFAEQVQGGFDQHLPVNVLEHARAKLEKWQALSAQHYHRSEYHSNQVSYWSKVVSTAEQRIDSLKGVVADLDRQIHSLRAERERLQEEMRKP